MRPSYTIPVPTMKQYLPELPKEIKVNVCHDEAKTSSYDYTDFSMRRGERGDDIRDHSFCGCEDYPCCGH